MPLSPSNGARELVAASISTLERQLNKLNIVEICKSLWKIRQEQLPF